MGIFAPAIASGVGAQMISFSFHVDTVLSGKSSCDLQQFHPETGVFRLKSVDRWNVRPGNENQVDPGLWFEGSERHHVVIPMNHVPWFGSSNDSAEQAVYAHLPRFRHHSLNPYLDTEKFTVPLPF